MEAAKEARCKRIAFLSMDDLSKYICDDDLTADILRRNGHVVETMSWRDPSATWRDYDAVIVRSTWDYHRNLPEFLQVLTEISQQALLLNSMETVIWNSDKGYLRDLSDGGIRITPTIWSEGEFALTEVENWRSALDSNELVIKPRVSASAEDTYVITSDFERRGASELSSRFTDRAYMVQPFLRGFMEEGEYSLTYFSGAFSHAVLKSPAPGDFRVQEEYNGSVCPAVAPASLIEAGVAALNCLQTVPLYARADFVRNASGQYLLTELELIEPSLYLRLDEGSADRFASAILKTVCD